MDGDVEVAFCELGGTDGECTCCRLLFFFSVVILLSLPSLSCDGVVLSRVDVGFLMGIYIRVGGVRNWVIGNDGLDGCARDWGRCFEGLERWEHVMYTTRIVMESCWGSVHGLSLTCLALSAGMWTE